jgi:hypothetical protein
MSKVPVDRATPQIQEPTVTPEQKVATGNDTLAKINASTNIASATDVASAAKLWAAANTALDTNNQAKTKARSDLATAETNEPALLRRWQVRKDATLTAIEAFGDGSKQLVQSFNVPVEERRARPTPGVPVNLRPMKIKTPTFASVRWDPTLGARGYLVQHATNPADATTYSAQIATSQARYHLAAQTTGTTIYFRVLACNKALPNGQTAYTAWVSVLVT